MWSCKLILFLLSKVKTRVCAGESSDLRILNPLASNCIQPLQVKLQSRDICIQTPQQPTGITGPTPQILTARWIKLQWI